MGFRQDVDYGRVVYYIVIACVVIAFLAFNYNSFKKHISSNPQRINDFSLEDSNMSKLRLPAVAGLFYSGDKAKLNEDVEHYLSNSYINKNTFPRMLIVPHAGYQYSAITAAKAYGQLQPFSDKIKTVILVGPAHRVSFEGVAISEDDFFATPLGKVAVNKSLAQEISKKEGFKFYNLPHQQEHSLEVQLPFLQKSLKDFQIVPIVYGQVEPSFIAKALSSYTSKSDTVIVFSADLSHYYDYETAKALDEKTANKVASNEASLDEHMSCGAIGINAAIMIAQKENFYPELLDMRNSGDTAGDKDSVVGYASWVFGQQEKVEEDVLTPLEQEVKNLSAFSQIYGPELLKIATASINHAVLNKDAYVPSREDFGEELFNKGASFVTLTKNAELRGCIGTLSAHQGIALDVAQNAVSAALEDGRFSPVSEKELKDISISISLLTDFERMHFESEEDLLQKIVIGIDGLVIRDGHRQGVFLPSVWKELPDKVDFLNNLKVKAGLSPTYWSDKIKIYRFRTVEIKQNEN